MIEHNKKTINDKELEILAFWQDNHIFQKSLEKPASQEPKDTFSFFDGPPFATGVPHHGHILASTIKDVIPRYKTMQGFSVRRTWGWDCHGLPLENLVEKKYNLNSKKEIENFGVGNFNEAARAMVLEYEQAWKKIIPRLGRFVDMDNCYKTMDASYTESIWWSFKTLYDKGLIYEGSKIMHICPRCETTLAQSEVAQGYMDVTDISVTAKFELFDTPGTFLLAWTTTPWTLPGNVALAVNSESLYAKIKVTDAGVATTYIAAKETLEKVFKDKTFEILEEFSGKDIIGKKYKPVFAYFTGVNMPNKDNLYKVVAASFVTTDSGTGIVHIAPAYGSDDYELGRVENLPMIKHVNMDGTFAKEVSDFKGMYVKQKGDTQSTDVEIIKKLAHSGKLFSKEKIIHSYPHCWRCETPLLNYATSSWFMDILKIKTDLIHENKKISWVPSHMQEGRFGKWLEGARDWALSRSRYWGAPLPVWKCSECARVEVHGSLTDLQSKLTAANTYSVMRHGECLGNTKDLADGRGDPANHLTDLGKSEVLASARQIQAGEYDVIICSPLPRAAETAKIVSDAVGGLDIIFDERLREFNFGVHEGKDFKTFWDEMRSIHYNFDTPVQGGESYRAVMQRVSGLLFECEQKYAGKKILFVTHGGIMWMMISVVRNFSDEQTRQYRKAMKLKHGSRYFIPNAYIEKLYFKPYPHSSSNLDFHRPYIDKVVYDCTNDCTGQMQRILDVFDCWYESGSMPFASLHYPFENKDLFEKNFPADFIAEGLDQTRGWFYSLLNLSVGLFGRAAFKQVIVNGLTMASDGQKMSKSKNNFTDPAELIEKYGADSLRFALISCPLVRGENTAFPDTLVDEVSKKLLQRFENVYTFYLMYAEPNITPAATSSDILDQWVLSRLYETVHDVTIGLENYELDLASRPFESFFDDLSTWYLRRSRERLKGEYGDKARLEAVQTLRYVLTESSKILAPFMPFLAERVYLGTTKNLVGYRQSVHLEGWPITGQIDELAIINMQQVRRLVSLGLEARNKAGIKVRQPLQAITIKSLAGLHQSYLELLQEEINIKQVLENPAQEELVILDELITPELQKEGDYRDLVRAVKDLRKESGLQAGEIVSVTIYAASIDAFDISNQASTFIQSIKLQLEKECSIQLVIATQALAEEARLVVSGYSIQIRIN